MKEKFDRTKPHRDIGELRHNPNETLDERIGKLRTDIQRFANMPAPDSRCLPLSMAVVECYFNALQELEKENTHQKTN